jgi:hypothetical protein
MMQSAVDSAMNFLDAHGLKWTLTSTTPVVCKCTAPVDLHGRCADFPMFLWIASGGSTEAVVQQFDEQAILQCATFSQGDKRQATVNGSSRRSRRGTVMTTRASMARCSSDATTVSPRSTARWVRATRRQRSTRSRRRHPGCRSAVRRRRIDARRTSSAVPAALGVSFPHTPALVIDCETGFQGPPAFRRPRGIARMRIMSWRRTEYPIGCELRRVEHDRRGVSVRMSTP